MLEWCLVMVEEEIAARPILEERARKQAEEERRRAERALKRAMARTDDQRETG